MPETNQDVSTAEVFRAAADEARKALAAGISDDVAPSNESGSSPAIGAESAVPEVVPPATEEASKQEEVSPEVKPEGVVIDPEAAWKEYKTDDERKKALAHNKAYAIEMAKKARELEAKLAEKESAVPDKPVVEAQPEVVEQDPDYDTWVADSLKKPDTKDKTRIAELANEYNQYLANNLTPAEVAVSTTTEKVREAEASLREREAALKFLQSRKDPSLYESDIAEAKEGLFDARFALQQAQIANAAAVSAHEKAEKKALATLGTLRREAREVYDTEIKTRRDSISTKKAEEEASKFQSEVNKAWEDAKQKAIASRGDLTEEAKKLLLNAADGAIIRVASENKTVSIGDYQKFIEESWKPFQSTKEQARQEAVKSVIAITDEPTPDKPTSDTRNVDVQPTNFSEWKLKARKALSKAS